MKKVKILILGSKEYPFGCGDDKIKSGGIETYTEGLVDELKKNKDINIAIITRKFQNQKSHQINENIEIWRVNWIRGFYFRNISFNFSAFIKAFSLDFDVILAQGPIAVFFSVILSKFKKFKLIARCAGISTSQPQYSKVLRKIFFYLEKYVYERADAVVFGSAEEKTQFEKKLGFMPKNNKIIPSGVKIHIFVSDKKTIEKYNPKNKTLICFVGRLLQVKGVKYLIQAVN
ncbi:MAG: glycosyltransferase family 4 protein, partial [Candidatus Aenigmarchaeota archaeon]|nr:glycosyltransferase family 4 protein [Candidatus Aenigmarchaeota archaeon]